jgi:hypothetical protein
MQTSKPFALSLSKGASVIPAQAGIQWVKTKNILVLLDSRIRENDVVHGASF